MTRTLFMAAILGLTLTLGGHPSAHSADKTAEAGKAGPNYVHTVIFYLKKEAPKDEDKALIADAFELLSKIPSVKGIRAGTPAKEATPDLAVKDYTAGLLILVDDFKGLKEYLDHPLHLKYVDKHLKHIDKVLVYDFVQQHK